MNEKELKAVALKYPEWADAPFISASAKGYVAEQMLKVAEENDVPVVQNENMADVLSLQNIGQYIPEETYAAVAAIFVFISKLS